MTIYFASENPDALLKKFKDLINQSEQEGKIKTWEEHGGGFRHTAPDVKDFGVFKARTITDKNSGQRWLRFDLKTKKSRDNYAYAYFHGHLLQAFIVHLNKYFDRSVFRDTRNTKKPV
jgi:hypothetical protein